MKTTKKNTEKKTSVKPMLNKPMLNKPYKVNAYGMVLLEGEGKRD